MLRDSSRFHLMTDTFGEPTDISIIYQVLPFLYQKLYVGIFTYELVLLICENITLEVLTKLVTKQTIFEEI